MSKRIEHFVRDAIIKGLGLKSLTPEQYERVTDTSAAAYRAVIERLALQNSPMHLMAVQFCEVVGVDPLWVRTCRRQGTASAYRTAIQWMLYKAIVWPVKPSLNEVADATATTKPFGHTAHHMVSFGLKRIEHHAAAQQIAIRLLNYCDANGIATHPRPAWAKEAA
jgi:hypothetical protein